VGQLGDLLFSTHDAIRFGRAIEPYDPLRFEEPIPPDNIAEFQKVADAVRIPVASGERHTTKVEFAAMLRAGVKIQQSALGPLGAIWDARKLAILVEPHNGEIAPHPYAGPIEWAANTQLAASIPNLLKCETIQALFHSALIKKQYLITHLAQPLTGWYK